MIAFHNISSKFLILGFFSSVFIHTLLWCFIYLWKPDQKIALNNQVQITFAEPIKKQNSSVPKKKLKPQKEKKPKVLPKPISDDTQPSLIKQESLVKNEKSVKYVEPQEQQPSNVDEETGDMGATYIETLVDKAAKCPTPEIPLSPDAINAGITSGKIILEIIILSSGEVSSVKLLKGTGFSIDEELLKKAKLIKCTPAYKDGIAVKVIKRLQWTIVR